MFLDKVVFAAQRGGRTGRQYAPPPAPRNASVGCAAQCLTFDMQLTSTKQPPKSTPTASNRDPVCVALPSLYTYLDYRRYLRDWYEAKKAINSRFSHRAFVRRTGQRSPSLLADVIDGRRNLTDKTVQAFARALRLEGEEPIFFAALVELDQADTDEAKNIAFAKISSSRRFREARRLEGEGFRYLTNWTYPAIHELASRPDFQDDPSWVAAQLRPRIDEAQATEALEALRELGMLVDGEPRDAMVLTPKEVEGLAATNYHRGMLHRATEALDSFSSLERHFLGVTVAVPQALLPELKQELNALHKRIMARCTSAGGTPDQVVQIGLHFFPLSSSANDEETP